MIEQQIRPWDVLDLEMLELLSLVRREDFVPLAHKALAFVDMQIPLLGSARGSHAAGPLHARAQGGGAHAAGPARQAARKGAGNRHRLRLHGGAAGPPRPARGQPGDRTPNWCKWPAPTCSAPASATPKCARPTAPAGLPAESPFDVIVLSGSVAEVPPAPAGTAQDRRPPGCRRRLRADDARHFHHAHRRNHLYHGSALGHGGAAAGPFPRAVALPVLSQTAMIDQVRPADLAAWFQSQPAGGAGAVVLDVREPWELQTASVKADERFELLAIPMNEVPARLAELDPERPIACLCHHGATQPDGCRCSWPATASTASPTSPAASTPGRREVDTSRAALLNPTNQRRTLSTRTDHEIVAAKFQVGAPGGGAGRRVCRTRCGAESLLETVRVGTRLRRHLAVRQGRSTTPTCTAPSRPRPASCLPPVWPRACRARTSTASSPRL